MEHSAAFSLQHNCGAEQIKFRKAHIAKGKGRHQAFNVVVARAGKGFAVPGAVQMVGLAADFQGVLAGLQNKIQRRIVCDGVDLVVYGIVGYHKGNVNLRRVRGEVFCAYGDISRAVHIKSAIFLIAGEDEHLGLDLFGKLAACQLQRKLAARLCPHLKKAAPDPVKIQNEVFFLVRKEGKAAGLGAQLLLHPHGDGGGLRVPDVRNAFRGEEGIRRDATVEGLRRGVGAALPDKPAFVGVDFQLFAVGKEQNGGEHKPAVSLGVFADVNRQHLNPGEKAQLRRIGPEGCGKRIEIVPDGLISEKITAHARGTGGNDAAIAEKLKGGVAAKAQLRPDNLLGKNIGLLKFRNGVVVRLASVETAVDSGLFVFVKAFRQPDPLLRMIHPLIPL